MLDYSWLLMITLNGIVLKNNTPSEIWMLIRYDKFNQK